HAGALGSLDKTDRSLESVAQSLARLSARSLPPQTQDLVAPSPLAVREPVLQSPVAPHRPRTGIRDRAALPATAANRCQIASDLGSTSDVRSLGRARVASSRWRRTVSLSCGCDWSGPHHRP